MSAVVPIRSGVCWNPAPNTCPDGLTLSRFEDSSRNVRSDGEPPWLQLWFAVRGDAESILAAKLVTDEQLATLPPCGQRTFDTYFGDTWKGYGSVCTRVTVKRQKTAYRVEVIVYSDANPQLARFRSWFGAPLRARPHLRLV